MLNIKKTGISLLLSIAFSTHCFATWSIIIMDPKTGEIGIAGASCSYNCYGIGEIVPGKGAIIVQAMSNKTAKAEGLKMLISNKIPEEIIEALRSPRFDPENQQYAVIDFVHLQAATYTGNATHPFNGTLVSEGISVQGNILANNEVLHKVFETALEGQQKSLRIDLILIMALEAGSKAGGDKRCGDQKATSAFITVMKPEDNWKNPHLNLKVFGQHKGGPNAVEVLKEKYNKWLSKN